MNRTAARISPYAAILASFFIYLSYWAEVVRQCPQVCNRGYDDFAYYADFTGLLAGSWPGATAFYQSPLPGFFLGLTHALFRYPVDNLAIPYLVQLFLTTLTAALAYRLARTAFSVPASILTILLLGGYEFVKFYATTVEANILAMAGLTAALAALARYQTSSRRVFLVFAGLCLGLAALGRSNNLVIIGVAAVWWLYRRIPVKRWGLDLLLLTVTCLLVILPASLHNYGVSGKVGLATTAGVYNFTMGNLPGAPGTYWDGATESLQPALQFMTQQPAGWLLLTLRKLQLFFTFPWSPAPFQELPLAWLIPWSIFGLLGAWQFLATFTPRRSLLHFALAAYTASIVLTHVEDEYRLPILPVLAIFVAVTLLWLAGRLAALYRAVRDRRRQKPALVFAGSLLVLSLFIFQVPGPAVTFPVDSIKSEPAYGGVIVGQRFQVKCPNLNEIQVKMSAPPSDKSITFYLKENSVEGPTLYTQAIPTAQLGRFEYQAIGFPAITTSAGKSYVFYLDTAQLQSPAEGVFFAGGRDPFAESLNRLDPTPRVPAGAFVSLGHLDGNLAFVARCQAGPLELAGSALDRLAAGLFLPAPIAKILCLVILAAAGVAWVGSGVLLVKGLG